MGTHVAKYLITFMFLNLFHFAHGQQNTSGSTFLELKKSIGNSQLIAFGESGHGYETFNKVKSEMLLNLKHELGVQAVLFESPFNAFIISYLNEYDLKKRMNLSLYPFWNTTSVKLGLDEMISNEKSKKKPLILGCDIQEDCRYTELSRFLISKRLIINNAKNLERCDSILAFYIGTNFSRKSLSAPELHFLLTNYNKVLDEFASSNMQNEINLKLLNRCIVNRMSLCRYLSIKNASERMRMRDSLMAQNVLWIKKNYFEKEPVVIWAANSHIAALRSSGTPRWMGEWLSVNEEYSYYTIGLEKKNISKSDKKRNEKYTIIFPANNSKFDAIIYLSKLEKIKSDEWITICP